MALAVKRLFAACRPLKLSVYWTRSRAAGGLAVLILTSLLDCVPVVVVNVPTGCCCGRSFVGVCDVVYYKGGKEGNMGLYVHRNH